jgi:hypothetical protein
MNNPGIERCSSCGAGVDGDLDACREFFEALLAQEYTDFRYARLHRVMVDAYALQHPGRYMASSKSFVAHLTGACAAIEYDNYERINRAVQAWLSRNPSLDAPPVRPAHLGDITVIDAFEAPDPESYSKVVRQWVESAWRAWSDHHGYARDLIAAVTQS